MAKRVKQADGRYCYTENCRVHDRSLYDSTGLQAVQADALETRRRTLADTARDVFKSQLYYVPAETADKISDSVSETILNNPERFKDSTSPFEIAKAVEDIAKQDGVQVDPLHVAYLIQNNILEKTEIRVGDQVVINDTGERGFSDAGTFYMGSTVIFASENGDLSRNDYAWFGPDDVSKVILDSTSPAREQVRAYSHGAKVPSPVIRDMFMQETSNTTRNAQAIKEVGKNGVVAKKNIRNFGNALADKYAASGLTRGALLKALSKEYFSPIPDGVRPEEAYATKSGLRGMINYLDPTGNVNSPVKH